MKIRVMEVLPTLRRAGAERMAVSLATGLCRDRFETRVVSLFDAFPGGFESVLEQSEVPVEHLGKRKGMDARMVPRLRHSFRLFRPNVIHTHSYLLRYAFPAALLAASRARMVHTVHNSADRDATRLGRLVNRVAFLGGVQPVAVGKEVARSFQEQYGFEPAAMIPNGVDLAPYRETGTRASWRRENGFSEDEFLAVSVARLEAQKNPLGLVDAFARALGADGQGQLLLVGEGTLEAAVRERVAALGLQDRIHLLGLREDVSRVLAASDVFVLASLWEGTPLAVIEAMAAGLPVVANATGGIPELAEDGVSGLLTEAGNEVAFAEALALLAGNEGLRVRMSRAARARAEDFSAEAMVAAYAALFERVTEGHARGRQ